MITVHSQGEPSGNKNPKQTTDVGALKHFIAIITEQGAGNAPCPKKKLLKKKKKKAFTESTVSRLDDITETVRSKLTFSPLMHQVAETGCV